MIGDPAPGEDALYRHNDILPVRGDGSQERIGICAIVPVHENLSGMIHDAEEYQPCV